MKQLNTYFLISLLQIAFGVSLICPLIYPHQRMSKIYSGLNYNLQGVYKRNKI
jgi:hypothetical protein